MKAFQLLVALVAIGGHVGKCISIPQVWVQTLQLVCTLVDSNGDILGPPIVRDVRTFTSLARFQGVENEQVIVFASKKIRFVSSAHSD